MIHGRIENTEEMVKSYKYESTPIVDGEEGSLRKIHTTKGSSLKKDS